MRVLNVVIRVHVVREMVVPFSAFVVSENMVSPDTSSIPLCRPSPLWCDQSTRFG